MPFLLSEGDIGGGFDNFAHPTRLFREGVAEREIEIEDTPKWTGSDVAYAAR